MQLAISLSRLQVTIKSVSIVKIDSNYFNLKICRINLKLPLKKWNHLNFKKNITYITDNQYFKITIKILLI